MAKPLRAMRSLFAKHELKWNHCAAKKEHETDGAVSPKTVRMVFDRFLSRPSNGHNLALSTDLCKATWESANAFHCSASWASSSSRAPVREIPLFSANTLFRWAPSRSVVRGNPTRIIFTWTTHWHFTIPQQIWGIVLILPSLIPPKLCIINVVALRLPYYQASENGA